MTKSRLRNAEIVFFDLGGVLVSDPWQSLLLTPHRGLADRLSLDRARVQIAGESLWQIYSSTFADENRYWADLGKLLDIEIPTTLVRELEQELLVVNPQATDILRGASACGLKTGVMSDNTSFWYPKQAKLLHLDYFVEPSLVFLSYVLGVTKDADGDSLFTLASSRVDPSRALVIDNDENILSRAAACRFLTLEYSMNDDASTLVRLFSAKD